ncbi:MAG: ATP-binding protein [Candidatus Micrarchaeota archaeon]
MKIHFPNSAFLGNIDPFLKSIDASNPDCLEITFNNRWVSAHPLTLSMVASLGLSLRQRNARITCEPIVAPSRNYLIRMGLFDFLGQDPGATVTAREPAGRFIPLTNITDDRELSRFIQELAPLLHLDKHPEQADAIKYVVSELVRNVLEHASSSTGSVVCAQYFNKTNRVSIGVADAGAGILTTISKAHEVASDVEALKLALTPGVTGTTARPGGTEANAGAGLFFVKSIAKINREFFLIYSGNAAYKLKKTPAGKRIALFGEPDRDAHSMMQGLPYWQGTAVGIDIALGQTQSFQQLLAMIRDVYRLDSARDKMKTKLRRATFI